jgi:L-fucose isomerase-like protein
MEPAVERNIAKDAYHQFIKGIKNLGEGIEVLEPMFVPYIEDLVVKQEYFDAIEKESESIDVILVSGWRIPRIERINKPIIILDAGNESTDVCAYLRSIGREAHPALDLEEAIELLHGMWVRKAVSCTRALVLTYGQDSPFGLMSNIRDLEKLRTLYGFEVVKRPFTEIFPYMDKVGEDEVADLVENLLSHASLVKIKKELLVNDVRYYLASKHMMENFGCNAFSTTCHELCASRIPQERKFVPCLTHSLLKDEGFPSGCEEDINALLAMTILMYMGSRPAFMGNPHFEDENLLSLHHSVPSLNMCGYGTKHLPYELWAFTGQGFGAKMQIDLSDVDDKIVTLARFNPYGDTMSVKTGEIVKSEFIETYCSPYYSIRMDNARAFMHRLADFGHHQVMVLGDWTKKLDLISSLMHFSLTKD